MRNQVLKHHKGNEELSYQNLLDASATHHFYNFGGSFPKPMYCMIGLSHI